MKICGVVLIASSLCVQFAQAQNTSKSNKSSKPSKQSVAPQLAKKSSQKTQKKAAPATKKKVKSPFGANTGGKYASKKYYVPTAPSVGMLSGLHATQDPLELRSSVALMVDADSGQVLFEKNAHQALPIASISKLMTALVVLDAQLNLQETLMIDNEDVNLEKYSRSRLNPGTLLSRYEALQLALMASENRAANVLTRYYPGGKPAFVAAMNEKASRLGMTQTHFNEGTGLSSGNIASAQDLVKLVKAAAQYPLMRELSTRPNLTFVGINGRQITFTTTNRLVTHPDWNIELQKTGYISEAGQCLVMLTGIEGKQIIMVLLDSQGKFSRLGDAQRLRDWYSSQHPLTHTAALNTTSHTVAQSTVIISPRN